MNEQVERVRKLVPSIILTVLSMIQAIALELYWGKLVASEFLWTGGWIALVGWLQFIALFFGILLIWLLYVSPMLRFHWMPSLEDTLAPFLIGLLEFALIDLTHPSLTGPWLLILAMIFTTAVFTSHTISRRARSDSANDYFFSQQDSAAPTDYRESGITIASLVLLGALLWIFPHAYWLASLALLLTLIGMSYQYVEARRFWLHSITDASSIGDDHPDSE